MADMAVSTAEQKTAKATVDKYVSNASFQNLVATRNRVVTVLTILTLITYYAFILLMAFGKDILSEKIAPFVTIGIPIGAAVIVISWILTFTYANWANKTYDRMVEEVKDQMGG